MPCPGRNEISVGRGSDAEHWDRFFALSEEAINGALVKLFEQRKDSQELVYNGSPESGVLKAKVFAPVVRFELEHKRCVTLVVRISSGTLQLQDVTVDLEAWELAVNVQLSKLLPSSRNVIKMENGADRRPTKLLAGEYSIYRLFAALSEAPWTLNESSSKAFHDGWHVPLVEHLEKNVEPEKSTLILGALKEWATNHSTSDFYTLGLELKLPTLKDNPLAPTHSESIYFYIVLPNLTVNIETTSLFVQLSYHVPDDEYDEAIRQDKKPQSSKQNPFSCLVFCERIKSRSLPQHRVLEFTANLANGQNTLYKQPEGALGTAAIHRNVFFNEYLLPELQAICAGIYLVPLKPLCWTDDSKRGTERFIIEPMLFDSKLSDAVSEEERKTIADARPANSRDAFYAFKRERGAKWLWKKTAKAPGNRKSPHMFDGELEGLYDMTTETSIKVKALTGKPRVVLEAETAFDLIHNQRVNTNSYQYRGIGDRITIQFKLDIKLVNSKGPGESGIISPVISNLNGATGLPSDYRCDPGLGRRPMTLNGRRYNSKDELRAQLMETHKNIFSELVNRFKNGGRFVAPGTSSLDFNDPIITKDGDLCCHLDYRP